LYRGAAWELANSRAETQQTYDKKSEDRGDQASEVECPFPSNDIYRETEAKRTDTGMSANVLFPQFPRILTRDQRYQEWAGDRIESREYSSLACSISTAIDYSRLNLQDGGSDQSNTLRPGEIQEITKSAQEPDTDLISTHAHLIYLAIDISMLHPRERRDDVRLTH
jgi:hypothetical protein